MWFSWTGGISFLQGQPEQRKEARRGGPGGRLGCARLEIHADKGGVEVLAQLSGRINDNKMAVFGMRVKAEVLSELGQDTPICAEIPLIVS